METSWRLWKTLFNCNQFLPARRQLMMPASHGPSSHVYPWCHQETMVPSCPPLSYEELQQINIWAHYPGRNWLNGPTKSAPYIPSELLNFVSCKIAANTKHLVNPSCKDVWLCYESYKYRHRIYQTLNNGSVPFSEIGIEVFCQQLGAFRYVGHEKTLNWERWWWQAGAILANGAILGGTICLAVTLEISFSRKKYPNPWDFSHKDPAPHYGDQILWLSRGGAHHLQGSWLGTVDPGPPHLASKKKPYGIHIYATPILVVCIYKYIYIYVTYVPYLMWLFPFNWQMVDKHSQFDGLSSNPIKKNSTMVMQNLDSDPQVGTAWWLSPRSPSKMSDDPWDARLLVRVWFVVEQHP